MKYRRLTREERYQIEALLNRGDRIREIARQLKRAPSTICREIQKGLREEEEKGAQKRIERRYEADLADRRTLQERTRPHLSLRRIQGELKEEVHKKLQQKWSPEQIAGWLSRTPSKPQVSYATIYRYMEREEPELRRHLRVLRKKRKNRKLPHWKKKEHMPDRVMITERPAVVDRRERLGDYERDTLLGKAGGAFLLTIVERSSRLLKMAWLPRKCSSLIHEATVRLLQGEVVHTITNDNSTEFARHALTAEALKAKIYFSHAYRAWERGSNENTNGLLRQYFPRKTEIPHLSEAELKRIETEINTRPRKILGYKTPLEVHQELQRQGVALNL